MKIKGTVVADVDVNPYEAIDSLIFDAIGYGWVDRDGDDTWLCTSERQGQREIIDKTPISKETYVYVTSLETARKNLRHVLQAD